VTERIDARRAAELLRTAGRVVVACHVNPDGDALGAALAISLGLSELGIEAPVTFGTSDGATSVPPSLSFLPGQDRIVAPEALIDTVTELDLVVTTDTGSADRLGPALDLMRRAGRVLVVDHHASNTLFGTHNLVDASAASTTAIVSVLLDELDITWTKDIATCLYAGLVTDTGSFRFEATTAEVHRLAARLHEVGVDHVEVGRLLFDTTPVSAVRVLGQAMAQAVLEPGLVWTAIPAAVREAAGLPLSALEGAIDLLRVTQEAEISAVLKGVTDTEWTVSLRSRGTADVSEVAVALGGGGHRFAAGYTAHGSADDVVAGLRAALAAR
jgi:phosphoesterase RecJ-like protein